VDIWKLQSKEIIDLNGYCEKSYYYKRKMGNGYASIESYFSHIFICVFKNKEQLLENWKNINFKIALNVQSKNKKESIIEKSNYYLCMFIEESISNLERNIVEGDTFCAKKYIFSQIKTNDYVDIIEKRIFSISINNVNHNGMKIKEIELQNFRCYDGNIKINLCDNNGIPVSFVLIYEKNGFGKTSIFDGIEFALRGEVWRIEEMLKLNKNEKIKGAIYHNREKWNNKAFVRLLLENKEEIYREVSPVVSNGNDTKIKTVRSGKDIVGNASSNKKWNLIILPHDKIDSFISAKTPAEQYKEWTKSSPELQSYQENFVETHTKLKKKEKELDGIKDELKIKMNEKDNLDNCKDSMCVIDELSKSYNQLVTDNSYIVFDIWNSDEQMYYKLINFALERKRKIETEIVPRYTDDIDFAKEIQLGDIHTRTELESRIKELTSNRERLERELKVKFQCDSAENNLRSIEEKCKDLKKQKAPLDAIQAYGVDKVYSTCDEYINNENEMKQLKNSMDFFKVDIRGKKEEIEKIRAEISAILTYKMSDEEIKKGKENISQILKIEEDIQKEENNNRRLKMLTDSYKSKIDELNQKVAEINDFNIPIIIEDVINVQLINNNNILNQEEYRKFAEYQIKYKKLRNKLTEYSEKMDLERKTDERIKALCSSLNEYLMTNREVNVCPLCHTKFASWEDLITNISKTNNDSNLNLENLIKDVISEMEQLSNEYNIFYKYCDAIKQKKLYEILANIQREEQDCNKINNDKKDSDEKIKRLNLEKNHLCSWFEQKKVVSSGYSSLEAFDEYVKEIDDSITKLLEKENKLKVRIDELLKFENESQNTYDLKEQKRIEIMKDTELFSYVEFIMDKGNNFDFNKAIFTMSEEINDNNQRLVEIQKMLDDNKDVRNIDIDLIKVEIESIKNQTKELKIFGEKISIFPEFTTETINRSIEEWELEREKYNKQKDILSSIIEENSAKEYIKRYKTNTKEIATLKQEIIRIENEKEGISEEFNDAKMKLEDMLRSYFGQSAMNEIYQKIDPHEIMKNIDYHLDFNENNEPQLYIRAVETKKSNNDGNCYRPEIYFSTAQLNTVAFSSFFSRAFGAKDVSLNTICIDDPIGHFDDMNILGFTDMMRSIIETRDCQIIMSTHDEKIFQIMERKLNEEYYRTCFIRLSQSDKIIRS
jgi:hypothetical protein